jgi:hypothetical protein
VESAVRIPSNTFVEPGVFRSKKESFEEELGVVEVM